MAGAVTAPRSTTAAANRGQRGSGLWTWPQATLRRCQGWRSTPPSLKSTRLRQGSWRSSPRAHGCPRVWWSTHPGRARFGSGLVRRAKAGLPNSSASRSTSPGHRRRAMRCTDCSMHPTATVSAALAAHRSSCRYTGVQRGRAGRATRQARSSSPRADTRCSRSTTAAAQAMAGSIATNCGSTGVSMMWTIQCLAPVTLSIGAWWMKIGWSSRGGAREATPCCRLSFDTRAPSRPDCARSV